MRSISFQGKAVSVLIVLTESSAGAPESVKDGKR